MNNSVADTPSRQVLADAIRALTQQWIASQRAPNAYEINNGLCEDYALEIIGQFGDETDSFGVYWADNFSKDGEGEEWDANLLAQHWPECVPTHGLTWNEIHGEFPRHAWIVLDGRHYDAECPEGVVNFFELPLLRRGMESFAAQKASSPVP